MPRMGDHIQVIDDCDLLRGANGAPVGEVDLEAPAPQAQNSPMHWTPVMSSFMLRRFHDLALQGVKTDKGFKEVHVRQVAAMLSEFIGVAVFVQQIYNHLRKWRQRWVKVVRLRDISGALWNDELHMIVLDEGHLNGHTKDHPTDAKFLNTPIENYVQMEAIFGGSQATGRFVMGSNEPLGSTMGQIDSDTNGEASNQCKSVKPEDIWMENYKGSDEEKKVGKKRKLSKEKVDLMAGMVKADAFVGEALKTQVHTEVHQDLYGCVMGCPEYSTEALMFALVYLLKNKAEGFCFA